MQSPGYLIDPREEDPVGFRAPVHRSLTEGQEIKGVPKRPALIVTGLCMMLYFLLPLRFWWALGVALVCWLIGIGILALATRRDPQWAELFPALQRGPVIYEV